MKRRMARKRTVARSVTKRKRGQIPHAVDLHHTHQGKLETMSRISVTRDTLNLIYTPGVGDVVTLIDEHPEKARTHTLQGRTVAIISDGSAVLGLGSVHPQAALPVLEGKALLFKHCAHLDAFPLVLNVESVDDIVRVVSAIAPTFAGISLEDIAAPKCFVVEQKLKEAVSIPVIHDDQHGTAIAVLAGLINAHNVVHKSLHTSRIAVIGAGAAGTAIATLLVEYGVGDVVVVDRHGIITPYRSNLTPEKEKLAQSTNSEQRIGGVLEAVAGADAVVGVSTSGTIQPEHIRRMAQYPIVFALANPVPEIMPEDAAASGAAVVATGRSDFPNQVNNALVFPGLFRGLIDKQLSTCTTQMKVRAAESLAGLIARPTAKKILPTLFDRRIVKAIASAL